MSPRFSWLPQLQCGVSGGRGGVLLVSLARVTLLAYLRDCRATSLPLIHHFLAAGQASRMLRSMLPSQLPSANAACTPAGGNPQPVMFHRCTLSDRCPIPIAAQQSCRVKVLAGSGLLHSMSCERPFLLSSFLSHARAQLPVPSLAQSPKVYSCCATI